MRTLVYAAAVLATAATAATARAEPPAAPLKVRGYALNLTGVGAGRSGALEIAVDRWSSAADGEALRRAMAGEGAAGLSQVLSTLPVVGTVTTARGGSLGLRFARELPAESGRRIVLATDRLDPPADGSRPQADTHDFLVVEVRLDASGKGEARTAAPSRLRYDAKAGGVTLASAGVEPVWVKDLTVITTP